MLPGEHNLTVTKEGYVSVQQQVLLEAGQTTPVSLALSPVSPFQALPLRTPGLVVATLAGLSLAVVAVIRLRSRND